MFSELPEREARTSRLDPKAGPAGGHPRLFLQALRCARIVVPDRDHRKQCRVNHAQSTPESLVGFRKSKAVKRFTENDDQNLW
jgi:hypothetical protein